MTDLPLDSGSAPSAEPSRLGRLSALDNAALTHTVRSRLNAILGSLELLDRNALPAAQEQFVVTALREGRALLYLVNDALDLGRIEAGELRLDDTAIDPVAIAEAALGAIALNLNARQISASCVIDPQTPVALRGDGLRFRQVLVNLLDHVCNASTSGALQLRLGPHPEDRDGTHLYVQLSDTGGTAQEPVRDKVFEPSYGKAGKEGIEDFGLGLTLCARFVEMMGGTIHHEAARNGSQFSFDVRFQRDANFLRLADRIAPVRNTRMVLLDADGPRRLAFANQGRTWGIKTAVAPDGERARTLIEKNPEFDLLLVQQDAPQAALAIAAAAGKRTAVLVALGAAPNADLLLAGELIPGLMWLSEPLRTGTLIKLLGGKQPSALEMPFMAKSNEPASQLHVLVVEDSEANRLVMRAQLLQLGCAVDCVENGSEALRMMGLRSFDLVLTDLSLPDMSGLEVASRIRRLGGELGRTPIVAVTGGVHPQDRERCLAAGMNGYLTKPLTKKDLGEILARHAVRAQTKTKAPGTLWDIGVLEALSSDSVDSPTESQFKTDVLEAFEHELEQRLERISKSRDAQQIAQDAHALKSTAETFGARHLSQLAKQLEVLCAEGAPAVWQGCKNELIKVGLLTLNEISDWLDADAGGIRAKKPD